MTRKYRLEPYKIGKSINTDQTPFGCYIHIVKYVQKQRNRRQLLAFNTAKMVKMLITLTIQETSNYKLIQCRVHKNRRELGPRKGRQGSSEMGLIEYFLKVNYELDLKRREKNK